MPVLSLATLLRTHKHGLHHPRRSRRRCSCRRRPCGKPAVRQAAESRSQTAARSQELPASQRKVAWNARRRLRLCSAAARRAAIRRDADVAGHLQRAPRRVVGNEAHRRERWREQRFCVRLAHQRHVVALHRRLQQRETAMRRPMTDSAFRVFVLDSALARRAPARFSASPPGSPARSAPRGGRSPAVPSCSACNAQSRDSLASASRCPNGARSRPNGPPDASVHASACRGNWSPCATNCTRPSRGGPRL